jgi:hypothetical protein
LTATNDGDANTVSFTMKELLGRIDHRLENIEVKLDGKASYAEVVALRERVDRLEAVRDRMIGGAVVLTLISGGVGAGINQILSG